MRVRQIVRGFPVKQLSIYLISQKTNEFSITFRRKNNIKAYSKTSTHNKSTICWNPFGHVRNTNKLFDKANNKHEANRHFECSYVLSRYLNALHNYRLLWESLTLMGEWIVMFESYSLLIKFGNKVTFLISDWSKNFSLHFWCSGFVWNKIRISCETGTPEITYSNIKKAFKAHFLIVNSYLFLMESFNVCPLIVYI